MKDIKIILVFTLFLIHIALKSQFIDISPYVIFKQGNLIGLTEVLGDLPDTEPGESLAKKVYNGEVYVPDSLDGIAVTVIHDVFRHGYIRKIRLPETLKYLYDNFDRNLEEVNIPPNLYYFYVGDFGTMDSIALPTPEKENHEFLGWKKFDTDVFIPGGSYVKSSSGHYYAFFMYLGKSPYIISHEDVIFYDRELKECYYRGAKDIVLPSTFLGQKLENIHERAFRNQDLKSVIFEGKFQRIGGFSWNKLSHIELPEGLIEIEKEAFAGNELEEVVIPSTVVRIAPRAFNSNQIKKLQLSHDLSYVSGFAQNRISELLLPTSVDTIGSGAFAKNMIKEVNPS